MVAADADFERPPAYPSRGAQVCAHTDDIGGAQGLDICCPADGKLVCDKLLKN